MDIAKCRELKEELFGQPEPQIVPITRFFDGNDDLGSIGCNLLHHPGINLFRDVLVGLLVRPDVRAVYAQISELDPGEDYWPLTDTVLVVGDISASDLITAVSELEPDEVAIAQDSDILPSIFETYRTPIVVIWWD
jgi:hypothetical protein